MSETLIYREESVELREEAPLQSLDPLELERIELQRKGLCEKVAFAEFREEAAVDFVDFAETRDALETADAQQLCELPDTQLLHRRLWQLLCSRSGDSVRPIFVSP